MSARNLRYMQKFTTEFKNDEFLQGLLAKLSWNHNQILLDKVKRVIPKLREVHPYEESTIGIVPLIDENYFE